MGSIPISAQSCCSRGCNGAVSVATWHWPLQWGPDVPLVGVTVSHGQHPLPVAAAAPILSLLALLMVLTQLSIPDGSGKGGDGEAVTAEKGGAQEVCSSLSPSPWM